MTINVNTKRSIKSTIISYSLVVLAATLGAVSVYVFVLPNRFSPGGLTGVAAAIYYLNPVINPGYMILAMNVPLLIAAFFVFNRQYVIKTSIAIVLSSGLLILFGQLEGTALQIPYYSTQNIILPAIAGGFVRGVAMGIKFKCGGSSGGSEIIGGFINKKWPFFNVARAILALDVTVILATAFAAATGHPDIGPMDIIILSIVNMVTATFICSSILHGFNSAIKFEIVTMPENEGQLSKDLILELGRSVTKIKARGGYTGQEKTILICIIKNRQIATFNRVLKKYPDTFAYMVSTKEVYGMGFSIPAPIPSKFGSAARLNDIEENIEAKNTDIPPPTVG